jgi:uncharacterized protein YerC
MNKSLQKTIKDSFLQLLEDLKTKDNIDKFLKDFLSEKEYDEFVKRLAVIYWLRKKRPTNVIKNNLGVTSKYINSIKETLELPGAKLAIKYMEAEEFANVWSQKIKKIVK